MNAQWESALLHGPRIVIDCSYEALMSAKELSSLGSQLMQMYGSNRSSQSPARLYVTSLHASSQTYRALLRISGFDAWRIRAHEADFATLFSDGREDEAPDVRGPAPAREWAAAAAAADVCVQTSTFSSSTDRAVTDASAVADVGVPPTTAEVLFDTSSSALRVDYVGRGSSSTVSTVTVAATPTAAVTSSHSDSNATPAAPASANTASPSSGLSRVVYLTADSPNVLHALDAADIYIIGGLVDRNRHKGIAMERAAAAGVRHARLPLDNSVCDMGTATKMLTSLHVFQILLEWGSSRSWASAFRSVVPSRKQQLAQVQQSVSASAVGVLNAHGDAVEGAADDAEATEAAVEASTSP